MKKTTFLISFLILIILSSTAIGQDGTEIHWAKHVKEAVDNRPNPKMFSEKEAWKVLIGEMPTSRNFTIMTYEFKNFNLMIKKSTTVEFYSRSSTSSVDGWWYTTILSFKEGDWEVNWWYIIFICIMIFAFYFLIKLGKWNINS